jgi:cell surface protein SprA
MNRLQYGFGNTWAKPEGYKQKNVLDSGSKSVRTYEEFDSSKVTLDYPISLDDYLQMRRSTIRQEIWDSLLTQYDLKKAMSQGDLANTLASATGINIPVPANPLMSIFGKPQISIGVNGEVNLRIGWRFDSQNLGTTSAFGGQSQSSPIFNQDIRVNVNAKIGDKLSFGTDWNTRNTYDYNNKFKIGYEGYDDDIIKLVEVGNVTFPIQSTLIGGGQSLFGARVDYQFGPLFLKTVFSQRRGQRKFVDVRGGVNKQPFTLRAYDFSKKHFFLDSVYKPIYDKYFENSTPIIPNTPEAQRNRVKKIQVFESTSDVREGVMRAGNSVAITDLPGKKMKMGENYTNQEKGQPIRAGWVERGNFVVLDSMQYACDMNLGTLHIKNLRQDRYYAVAYAIEGETLGEEDNIYYGTFTNQVSPQDTLILKLIYRPNPLPTQYRMLWDRMMKNIYEINATNVNVADTKINLWYIRENNDSADVLQGAPDKLVTIFGVDRVNNSTGTAPGDGIFDLRPPFFDAIEGELTFPSSKPFSDGLRAYFKKIGNEALADQYTFPQAYDTTYDIAARNTARDRFVISGEVTATRSANRISLGAFNLAQNSVKVTLDGVPLREYQDYVVDYYAGYITMKNPRATIPNANLRVEYEQQDILNIATKTLAGVRADYQLFKTRFSTAMLGGTFMHYDQSAVVDRVRIGDEPVSNTMFGFDGKFNLDAPWLTKLVDYLPFYDTKVPSYLNMQGEWAMMLPNPNKRTSEVASDNSSPVVYVDDFESAQRSIPLGLSPTTWTYSSPPLDFSIDSSAWRRSFFRGDMFWYQRMLPWIKIADVYPNNKNNIQGRRLFSPLEISFDPDNRGIYNQNPEFLDSNNVEFDPNNAFSRKPENRQKIWGGFQRLLSSFSTNFDTENIEYIEIMMNIVDNGSGSSRMFVDLGQISEDIIPDSRLSTEDGFTQGSPFPNGIIDINEDVGLDTLSDKLEKEVYPFPLNMEADPARDNYVFNFNKRDDERSIKDWMRYNRFEGNSKVSEIGQFPDTEILNDNNGQTISLADDYYSYEVNLDPRPDNNPQIVGGNPSKGWLLYRIPIRKPNNITGSPSFSNIQYIRVRFQGGPVKLWVEKWQLVGAQWQRTNDFQNVPPTDSVMQVSFVNLWDNAKEPDFYTMPPGVTAPRLLNNTDPYTDIRMNEQSLKISVKDLNYGEERMATRIFRSLDIFNYKKLKFFIHGDEQMPSAFDLRSIPKAYTFLRFGIDSMNYYEYRRPLTRGWQDLQINLEELTAIKQQRDTALVNKVQTFPSKSDTLAHFVVRGNPILTRIQFFGFGVSNPPEQFPNQLSTTIWVDELRLINPEQRSDWAAVGNLDLKIADLAQMNMSFNVTQPNFHRLEDRFGNRVSANSWSLNVTGNLEKFAPRSFSGMKLPITYTHSEQNENPEFVANSDVNLQEAASTMRDNTYKSAINSGLTPTEANELARTAERKILTRSQSLRISDNWALTQVKLGIPIKHWLMEQTLNAVTLGYSYSQDFERSPIFEQRFNWIWKLNLQYGIKISDFLSFSPFKWVKNAPIVGIYKDFRVNPLPTAINTAFDMMRRRQTEQSRYMDFPSPVLREFNAQRQGQFSWKITENSILNPLVDYNFTSTSTLVPFELDEFGQQRTGGDLADRIFFNNDRWVNLGSNTLHTQTFTLNTKPKLPDFFGMSRFFDLTAIYSSTYNWQNPLQQDPTIKDIAKSASVNTNLRVNNSLKLKALGDKWFGAQNPKGTKINAADTTFSIFRSTGNVLREVFLNWDKVDINLTQTNSSINPGAFGGNGFNNFWARGFTLRNDLYEFGPSVPYQLGLVSTPHGGFSVDGSNSFPFFKFNSFERLRPPNAVLQDNFRQQTTFEIKTGRRLWEGATLDLSWKTDMGFNRNQTIITDSNGVPHYTNLIAIKNINRSFMTFPSIFGMDLFGNTIEGVVGSYNQKKKEIDALPIDTVTKNEMLQEALSEAFFEELRTFKYIKGDAGKFLPSMNWTFRWEGLEKWSLIKDYVKRLSFEHNYQSTYQESIQITDLGKFIQNQTVQYGFQPLIGFTATLDEKKFKGAVTATLRYSTTKSFMVNTTSRSVIASQSTNDLTSQITYTMRGFDFPLFGIKLKNDLELSFLGTYKANKNTTYDILKPKSFEGGNSNNGWTLNGNSQIIIEPRARYTLSNIISAALFVRYEGTFNEGAAQPGYHTTQFGLDIRIAISGGR